MPTDDERLNVLSGLSLTKGDRRAYTPESQDIIDEANRPKPMSEAEENRLKRESLEQILSMVWDVLGEEPPTDPDQRYGFEPLQSRLMELKAAAKGGRKNPPLEVIIHFNERKVPVSVEPSRSVSLSELQEFNRDIEALPVVNREHKVSWYCGSCRNLEEASRSPLGSPAFGKRMPCDQCEPGEMELVLVLVY